MNKTAIVSIVIIILVILGGVWIYNKNSYSTSMDDSHESANSLDQNMESNQAVDTNTLAPATNPIGQPSSEKMFTVIAKDFSFTPSSISVKKGDKVKIILQNTDGFHDFKIDEFGVATKKIKDGDTDTVEFTVDKSGSFEYYCSVGRHREMGMRGSLTVTE